eukprot:SAG22_NODE_465_length_10181_cov_6.604444_21_plen_227_part_00
MERPQQQTNTPPCLCGCQICADNITEALQACLSPPVVSAKVDLGSGTAAVTLGPAAVGTAGGETAAATAALVAAVQKAGKVRDDSCCSQLWCNWYHPECMLTAEALPAKPVPFLVVLHLKPVPFLVVLHLKPMPFLAVPPQAAAVISAAEAAKLRKAAAGQPLPGSPSPRVRQHLSSLLNAVITAFPSVSLPFLAVPLRSHRTPVAISGRHSDWRSRHRRRHRRRW